MSMEIASSVEAIEGEAERILEEARVKASGILLEAREETRRILSAELPVDEVKTERDKIVSKARIESDEKIKASEGKTSEVSANAAKKTEGIVDLIVSIVTGAKLA